MATVSSDLLRRDVRALGDMLGEVITESAGSEALALIETIRQLSRRRRSGDHVAEAELAERIPKLTLPESRVVARAFSVFFDLANLAEDRHRIRVLRARVQEAAPNPISETIAASIAKLRDTGFTAAPRRRKSSLCVVRSATVPVVDGFRLTSMIESHCSTAKCGDGRAISVLDRSAKPTGRSMNTPGPGFVSGCVRNRTCRVGLKHVFPTNTCTAIWACSSSHS